jgi:YVTN family beta-propeller protein
LTNLFRRCRPLLALLFGLSAVSELSSPAGAQPIAVPVDTLIVLNKAEASVSLLNAATGAELGRIPVGVGPHEVAISPDLSTAVVCNYGEQHPGTTLSVIDLLTKTVIRTLSLDGYHRPHGIVFLEDGTVLVTAEQEQVLLKVDIASGTLKAFPTGGQQASHMVVASADGKRAYVANIGSGSVSVINLAGGAEPVIVPAAAGTEAIDLSPDGKELWVGNREAHTLSIIDTASLKVVASIDCPVMPIRLKFTSDGARVLVSCASSGELAVIDAAARKEIHRLDLREPVSPPPVPIGIGLAADGKRAFVACSGVDLIAVIDTEAWTIAGRLKAGRVPDGLGYFPSSPIRAVPANTPR